MSDLSIGSIERTEPAKIKKASNRSKHGCLTCRAKRVKCDETLPTCKRCDRLNLRCEQQCSRILPSLAERRRGFGPWKSRTAENWSAAPILPNLLLSPSESSQADDGRLAEPAGVFYDGIEDNWSTTYPSPLTDCSTPPLQILDTIGIMELNAEWLLPYPHGFDMSSKNDGQQSNSISLANLATDTSINDILLDNGEPLTADEKQALTYFRTSFSLSQTTRDPQWSTTTLLLEHSLESSEMLLHLILAVSLYDLQSRGEIPDPTKHAAQTHYEHGAQELAQALQSEQVSDHIAVLGSLYCVYAYMSRQTFVSSSKVDRLSFTAIEYIKKKHLDILFLTPNSASSASQPPSVNKVKAENSLIARLIMWLIKIDTQCCFIGCTPSLLDYFHARPKLMDGIQATSRLALQLNWGLKYPISQSIRDIESHMSMDMMADLLIMSYKIRKFNHDFVTHQSEARFFGLRKDLDMLEVKYGAVFYYGSSEMTLQPAMKLNCATSAAMFYATKIYLLRCGSSPFGTVASTEITHALGQLLLFAKHVCTGGVLQPVYEFQWSLFIACLETNDTIHQEWLASKICDARFQVALEKVFALKTVGGGEINLSSVRTILQGPP